MKPALQTTRALYAEAYRVYRAATRDLLAEGAIDAYDASVTRMRALSRSWDIPRRVNCPQVKQWPRGHVVGPWASFKRFCDHTRSTPSC